MQFIPLAPYQGALEAVDEEAADIPGAEVEQVFSLGQADAAPS